MTFEQFERAIDRDPIDTGIEFAGVTKNLRCVQMLLGGFYHAEYGSTLVGQAQSTGRERGLKITRSFGLW